ncbi:TetR/AcrR family transcriptional regulator [Skermania piniformis]|uniref:TetR family transcriptional regulator n=1 Tax=Skermania pinensis TaxID=39122 RepID=A0ABX8S615_9ACTN|nr:TetR/AcrR family transcriptional regulator [Skermania piniformis]QXQ12681.1 TetR family transcriptional regulator [Skermania piniformis]
MTAALPPNKHQEKSLRTRALLLDAALDSLADRGYGNTSISDITARAGVTRGAQVHHFHTRTELFAHAIDHLVVRQRESLHRHIGQLAPDTTPVEVLIGLVTATFAGRLGKAAIELYSSFATDDELRHTMLRSQHEITIELLSTCTELIGDTAPRDRLESTFWLTVNLIRGTTVDEMLGRDERRRRQVVDDWRTLATLALATD